MTQTTEPAAAGATQFTRPGTSGAGADDPFADSRRTTEGTVYTVTGNDWDSVVGGVQSSDDEKIIVNMGPQHPSTHGVLRIILEIDGETVTETRCAIGYLHTGIEKSMEYRTWTQGTTFCTRMDYLSPIFNETAFCLGVERLLGITDQIPERASVLRVLTMEINRIASHWVAVATGGMELGSTTLMTNGFREREVALDALEEITGLRMNHAYVRPGGVAQDIDDRGIAKVRQFVEWTRGHLQEYMGLASDNPIFAGRLKDVAILDLAGCMALGVTGPPLRATGLPWDLRKTQPYCGYETYEFDVPVWDTCDAFGRFRVRQLEIPQSLNIIEQCLDRLKTPGPVMVADKKIAWPAQLSVGSDGMGNSLEHIKHIMGESMEALIHHFKLVTEGFRVPAGQVYSPVESPRGELGAHLVSDGGTRPYRAHFRDPSFVNLQAVPAMCEGSQIADVIVAIASVDPVMGGVDR
jgi:NADH-quinone oxidoreductase subunit D